MLQVVAVELLQCPSCGSARHLSDEHTRRILAGRAALTSCRECRRSHPKPTEGDRQWWLERFSLEECRQMAQAMSFE